MSAPNPTPFTRRDALRLAGLAMVAAKFKLNASQSNIPVNPNSPALPKFSEHLIWDGFTYVCGMQAVDLDGDGVLDLTVSDTDGFVQEEPIAGEPPAPVPAQKARRGGDVTLPSAPRNSNLYWFKNDGKGNFTRHFLVRNDPQRRLERQAIADVNKDGLPDIVAVDNLLGDVLWFENPGPAALARDQPWKKHFISKGGMPAAEDLTVADFDGDGYPDVAVAGWRQGNSIKWFKNPGRSGGEADWPSWTIDNGFPARCVVAGDINGDGRPDLFATSDDSGQLLWYESPSNPTSQPWMRHVIDLPNRPGMPVFGQLADMNGDGRMDVVVAMLSSYSSEGRPGGIAWYENAGVADGRVQWRKHIITRDLVGAGNVFVADLNGDGHPDVAATGSRPGEVAWFENPGNPAGLWIKHVLKQNWPMAGQIIVADFDNDGRPDIVASADYGSLEVRWWHNDGP